MLYSSFANTNQLPLLKKSSKSNVFDKQHYQGELLRSCLDDALQLTNFKLQEYRLVKLLGVTFAILPHERCPLLPFSKKKSTFLDNSSKVCKKHSTSMWKSTTKNREVQHRKQKRNSRTHSEAKCTRPTPTTTPNPC